MLLVKQQANWQQQAPRTIGLILIALVIVAVTVVRFWRVIHWGVR
ncbi:MAG TPA: hypothetical protein VF786_08195 [Terriglobales bacterium]